MKKILKENKGFTLIETMIAMAFFSVALLGAGALYIRANQNNYTGNIISSANFLAKTTLEEIKNKSLTSITASTTLEAGLDENGKTGGIFTRQIVISEIAGGDARQVAITITWPDNKRTTANGSIQLVSNVKGSGL